MTRGKQISCEKRAVICALRKERLSLRAKKINVSLKGLVCTFSREKDTSSFADRKRSRRPTATTTSEDRFIVTTAKRNRRLTTPNITQKLNESRAKKVSLSSVKDRLLAAGFRGRVAVKILC